MKTTLDLPDALVKKVKLHALHEGQKLKDAVADLLRKGLATSSASSARVPSPGVKTDPKTGLPFFPTSSRKPITKMSSAETYALIHQTQAQEDMERLGLSFRR